MLWGLDFKNCKLENTFHASFTFQNKDTCYLNNKGVFNVFHKQVQVSEKI
jgi:hypothetical protein